MLYGIDISHHQGAFDLARTRREGFDFAFLKATEGSSFVDSKFAANLANARAAGLLVAAYHYQRGDSTAAAQAAHIMRTVPRDVPVILDVEANGGDANLTRDIIARLAAAGWRSPLLYLPRWYWQQIGSPSLSGLPPLWYSRYANNQGGYASEIYERNADWFAQHWTGYGGLPVAVLQFTSSATVAGHTPVDANAYQGTRDQLAALLGTNPTPEDDLTPDQAQKLDQIHYELFGPRGPQGQIVGWGTKAGNHTAIGMLVQVVNALLGPAASRVPGSAVQVTAVDAIRNTDGIAYQLPALIAAAGHTDPAEVAAALRPIVADVVGPIVGDAVRAELGADNDATAAAIVDGIADRLATNRTGAAA